MRPCWKAHSCDAAAEELAPVGGVRAVRSFHDSSLTSPGERRGFSFRPGIILMTEITPSYQTRTNSSAPCRLDQYQALQSVATKARWLVLGFVLSDTWDRRGPMPPYRCHRCTSRYPARRPMACPAGVSPSADSTPRSSRGTVHSHCSRRSSDWHAGRYRPASAHTRGFGHTERHRSKVRMGHTTPMPSALCPSANTRFAPRLHCKRRGSYQRAGPDGR